MTFKRTTPITALDLDPTDLPDATSSSKGGVTLAQVNGRRPTLIYDEFSRYTNGALNGQTPLIGGNWVTSGLQPTTVTSGLASSSGTGYLGQVLAEKIAMMGCECVWSGTGANSVMGLLATSDATMTVANAVHFIFGPNGFNITLRKDGGSFDSFVAGAWRKPMKLDGTTVYRVAMRINGPTVTVFGPNGEVTSATDARVEELNGTLPIWEPNTSGTQCKLKSVVASSFATTGLMNADDVGGLASLGANRGPNDQVVGNRAKRSEVMAGVDTSTGMPAVTFGTDLYRTQLASAVAIGFWNRLGYVKQGRDRR